MKKIIISVFSVSLLVSVVVFFSAFDLKKNMNEIKNSTQEIVLPKPTTTGGMPLMDALKQRKSSREFSSKKISLELLSNLLWAADGVSREESGKRTAPTANDTRAMDIYVVMEDGAYLFNAEKHSLELVVNKDLRAYSGKQDFVKVAPVNLIYVEDYSKHKSPDNKEMYGGAHAGFIGQNVYLFCASSGLNTVIRAYLDKDEMKKQLNLKEEQSVILAQTVGYPE